MGASNEIPAGAESRTTSGPPPPSPSSDPSGFHRFLLAVQPGEVNPRVWSIVRDLIRAGVRGIACHVIMRPTTAPANEADGSPANEEEQVIDERIRTRLIEHLGDRAREIPVRILHGDPGQRICEYAEHAQCDLIVLGTRSKPSFADWVRGSVSQYVARNSRRSVLLTGD